MIRQRALLAIGAATLLVGALGCRPGRALLADPDEYALYRETRILPSLEDRLRAAQSYLREYPQGTFAVDVQRAHRRAEDAFWISKRGSVAGLRAYLEALPTGPHAPEARRALEARLAASVDLLGRGAAATEDRLASAAIARAAARDELGAWIRRLADERVFDGSLGTAPAALVVAWSLALPAPRCEPVEQGGRRCRKLVERSFALPAEAGAQPRAMVIEITIDEDAEGLVCAATVAGPALFSRREEAASLRPSEGGDGRARAVLAATALVRSTLETRSASTGPCVETTAGEGAELACGTLRVAVLPGSTPGADDVVRLHRPGGEGLSRASSCPAP